MVGKMLAEPDRRDGDLSLAQIIAFGLAWEANCTALGIEIIAAVNDPPAPLPKSVPPARLPPFHEFRI